MPAIKVSKLYKDVSNKQFGIRARHAEEVVAAPDRTAKLVEEAVEVRVHRKRVDGDRPHHLLVVETELRDGAPTINLALKVNGEIDDNIEHQDPLRLLEKLVQRFGLEMEIGGKRSKFFLQERIPVQDKDPRRYLRIPNQKNKKVCPITVLRSESLGADLSANCTLCFCIDIDAYRRWLKKI